MKVPLQAWYDKWFDVHRNTDLIYAKSADRVQLRQVHFVRDVLAAVMWQDIPWDERPDEPEPRNECKETAWVVGEHYSKSVTLPVFLFERPDLGLKVIMRDNFHDWNVSVVSEKPIKTDLEGFVLDYPNDDQRERNKGGYKGGYWGYMFFQGFPPEYHLGPYSNNPRAFSTYMNSDHALYTFLWLIMRDIRRNRGA